MNQRDREKREKAIAMEEEKCKEADYINKLLAQMEQTQ